MIDPTPNNPESIRRDCLGTESGIKTVGWLCYLVAGLLLLVTGLVALMAAGVTETPPDFAAQLGPAFHPGLLWLAVGFYFLIAAAHVAIGYGLVQLHVWARWMVVILTGLSLFTGVISCVALALSQPKIGFLAFAGVVAVHGMILYPLLTRRAGLVFSNEYREIIRATPEVRARMHWLLKGLIALIVLGILSVPGYILGIYLGIFD